jgi:hypothetical protein
MQRIADSLNWSTQTLARFVGRSDWNFSSTAEAATGCLLLAAIVIAFL